MANWRVAKALDLMNSVGCADRRRPAGQGLTCYRSPVRGNRSSERRRCQARRRERNALVRANRLRVKRLRPSLAQPGLSERSLPGSFLAGRPRVPRGPRKPPPQAFGPSCAALRVRDLFSVEAHFITDSSFAHRSRFETCTRSLPSRTCSGLHPLTDPGSLSCCP